MQLTHVMYGNDQDLTMTNVNSLVMKVPRKLRKEMLLKNDPLKT